MKIGKILDYPYLLVHYLIFEYKVTCNKPLKLICFSQRIRVVLYYIKNLLNLVKVKNIGSILKIELVFQWCQYHIFCLFGFDSTVILDFWSWHGMIYISNNDMICFSSTIHYLITQNFTYFITFSCLSSGFIRWVRKK